MTLPTPTPMPMPTPSPMPMPMPRVRRLALLGVLVLGLAAAVLSSGRDVAAQSRVANDPANTQALLDAMRGTAPIPCGLALSVIEGNSWGGWNGGGMVLDTTVDRMRDWLAHGMADPAVVPVLRAAMAPGDACVRQTAARLLGRTRHPRAVTALTEALRDTDAYTRELAAIGLALSEAAGAYTPLIGALRDAEPRVRAASAMALGKLGDHRATADLVPVLQRDRDPAVRRAAAMALGALD